MEDLDKSWQDKIREGFRGLEELIGDEELYEFYNSLVSTVVQNYRDTLLQEIGKFEDTLYSNDSQLSDVEAVMEIIGIVKNLKCEN